MLKRSSSILRAPIFASAALLSTRLESPLAVWMAESISGRSEMIFSIVALKQSAKLILAAWTISPTLATSNLETASSHASNKTWVLASFRKASNSFGKAPPLGSGSTFVCPATKALPAGIVACSIPPSCFEIRTSPSRQLITTSLSCSL